MLSLFFASRASDLFSAPIGFCRARSPRPPTPSRPARWSMPRARPQPQTRGDRDPSSTPPSGCALLTRQPHIPPRRSSTRPSPPAVWPAPFTLSPDAPTPGPRWPAPSSGRCGRGPAALTPPSCSRPRRRSVCTQKHRQRMRRRVTLPPLHLQACCCSARTTRPPQRMRAGRPRCRRRRLSSSWRTRWASWPPCRRDRAMRPRSATALARSLGAFATPPTRRPGASPVSSVTLGLSP
jgi:hypothetical protein